MKYDYLMSKYKDIFLRDYVNVFLNKFKIKELTEIQNYALFNGLLNNPSLACCLLPEWDKLQTSASDKAHSLVFLTYAGITWNRYGLPIDIQLVDTASTNSLNGQKRTVDKDVVLCYLNNDLGGSAIPNYPLINTLRRYALDKASKRALMLRAAKRMSIPWLINAGSLDQEELKELNELLYVSDDLLISTRATDDIVAIQPGVKADVLEELYNDLCCFDDEVYTLMGCPAPSFRQKKERMLTNEIDVHMLRGKIYQDIMLNSIKGFIERIKKVLGVKLTLEVNDVYEKEENKERENARREQNNNFKGSDKKS